MNEIITVTDPKEKLKFVNLENYKDHYTLFTHFVDEVCNETEWEKEESFLESIIFFSKERLEKIKN